MPSQNSHHETYTIENLKTDFGVELAERYMGKVLINDIKKNIKTKIPVMMAKKWLLQDGNKKQTILPIVKQKTVNQESIRMAEQRTRLESQNKTETDKLQKRLSVLADELQERSMDFWIKPLLFVQFKNGTITLFHEQAGWLKEHYSKLLSETLGFNVEVINNG
jgi:hypothetical protein